MKRLVAIASIFLSLALGACVHSGHLGAQPDAPVEARTGETKPPRETLTNLSETIDYSTLVIAPPEAPERTPEQLVSLSNPVFSVNSVPSWWSEAAPDDGSFGVWAPNYYITHWWTPEGQAVLALQPGQSIVIDGNAYLIEGAIDFDRSKDVSDVYARIGRNWVFVQTCIPNTDPPYVRIVYGR